MRNLLSNLNKRVSVEKFSFGNRRSPVTGSRSFSDEVLAGMQPTELSNALRSEFFRGRVVLSMPKFKIEYTFDKVQNILSELGVKRIFSPGDADFGNLFLKVSASHWRARPLREPISGTSA